MRAEIIRERTTLGVELRFEENGVLIAAAAVTELKWELHSRKKGFANPVKTATVANPATNPFVISIDLRTIDQDVVGRSLFLDTKVTYNSALLGAASVQRMNPPLEFYLDPSPIAT